MNSPKFKEGDIVVLRSGGHKMTIEYIEKYKNTSVISGNLEPLDEPEYGVVWFDDKLNREKFTESVLKLSEE